MAKAKNETTTPPPLMSGRAALAMLDTVDQLKKDAPLEKAADAAEIHQGCAAMLAIFNNWRDADRYSEAVLGIEEHAKIVAPIKSLIAEGMKAKARVLRELAHVGMAGYAERILAESLAVDVLGGAP